jgi:hypothetical protein
VAREQLVVRSPMVRLARPVWQVLLVLIHLMSPRPARLPRMARMGLMEMILVRMEEMAATPRLAAAPVAMARMVGMVPRVKPAGPAMSVRRDLPERLAKRAESARLALMV